MKKLTALISGLAITAAFGSSAFATDVYVVNFRNAKDVKSQQLDGQLASALAISGVNAEEVIIDTSSFLFSTSGLVFQASLLLLTLSQSALSAV